jgi:hypothetical protein
MMIDNKTICNVWLCILRWMPQCFRVHTVYDDVILLHHACLTGRLDNVTCPMMEDVVDLHGKNDVDKHRSGQ